MNCFNGSYGGQPKFRDAITSWRDDRRNLELIGCGELRQDSDTVGQAELRIELAPQYWGRYAYAIEIGKALIDFGFRNLGLEEIIGISVNVNLRVSRLAERYGFQAIALYSLPFQD